MQWGCIIEEDKMTEITPETISETSDITTEQTGSALDEFLNLQVPLIPENYLNTNYSKELIGEFLGDNADYYFRKWEKAGNPEKKTSFNLAAFLIGGLWLGYRKMYRVLLVMLAIFLVLDIVQFMVNVDFNSAISAGAWVVLGISGNTFYFMEMKRKLANLSEHNFSISSEDVRKIGGTSWLGVGVAVLMLALYIIVSALVTMGLDMVIR